MHEKLTTDTYLAGNLIGFTTGLLIAFLLLTLTLRAAKLPGNPAANILFAICAISWNLGGFVYSCALAFGLAHDCQTTRTAMALQFTGVAVWPISILTIWRDFAIQPWQRKGARVLQFIAFLAAALIALPLWSRIIFGVALFPFEIPKHYAAFNGSILMVSGIAVSLWGRLSSRVVWVSSMMALLGVFGSTSSILILINFRYSQKFGSALGVIASQSVLLILLGSFFLFARFRFADLFIRKSLRILLASFLAVVLVLILDTPIISRLADYSVFPRAISVFVATILGVALLLCFALLDQGAGAFVNHWILQAPDYRNAVRGLVERLRRLELESEMIAVVEKNARHTLELDEVRWIPISDLPPAHLAAEIHEGEMIEIAGEDPLRRLLSAPGLELLVPVRAEGKVIAVLAISPGLARRGLVSQEVDYLRTIAGQLGSRLDSLHAEREAIERQSREALMLQQLSDAELRALRAQINPHFLFNSLNSIANLIMTNPDKAEIMTLRLARVFRYALAHSSRPLTSVHEEMDFLRAYLQIEEARFGTRLRVEFQVAEDAEREHIPSLILQPLVENALKHGLAPKLGPGRLWVSAHALGDRVHLKVEDDGVGVRFGALLAPNESHRAQAEKEPHKPLVNGEGVGLANIAQRLATLYQNEASVRMEPRELGGTRVIVSIPRNSISARVERYEKSSGG